MRGLAGWVDGGMGEELTEVSAGAVWLAVVHRGGKRTKTKQLEPAQRAQKQPDLAVSLPHSCLFICLSLGVVEGQEPAGLE